MAEPIAATTDPILGAFVAHFEARFGAHLLAVVTYGSYLRGKRDTVLDFYLLLDSYGCLPRLAGVANRLLPPNVYHVMLEVAGARHTAKVATITLDHFARCIGDDFHSYFWARFAQPCVVLQAREPAVRARIGALCHRAAERVLTSSIAIMPQTFTSEALWRQAFALSYGAELRAENPQAAQRLYSDYRDTLDAHLEALAAGLGLARIAPCEWRHRPTDLAASHTRHAWRRRRLLGKCLSVARLLKAAFTFNDPLDYVVWKVARHSGVVEEPTALQRRHPLLFGWRVLWRLYRRGGFR